jgi:large subunit ribosomal protein L6
MSRIGKQPVQIPDKVKIDIKGTTVSVEGPKGKVSKTFADVVKIEQKDNKVTVSPTEETRFSRAMYGTARSVIAGMVKGVSKQ